MSCEAEHNKLSSGGSRKVISTPVLILLGDTQVGKSSLLQRMADDKFTPDIVSTIGIDLRVFSVKVNKGNSRVKVWDTAGSERFRSLLGGCMQNINAIVFVVDCKNDVTTSMLYNNWYQFIKGHINVPVYIIVNKWDSWQEVSEYDNEFTAKEDIIRKLEKMFTISAGVFFVSAKTGEGVKTMISDIVNNIYACKYEEECFNDSEIIIQDDISVCSWCSII